MSVLAEWKRSTEFASRPGAALDVIEVDASSICDLDWRDLGV
jgi:hypothetical protein